jgi:arylsulfatase A-like enzyme
MLTGAAPKNNPVAIYAYTGLAFLLWENAVGSLLGVYHFELRRTLWSLIYYGALFFVFGGLTEGLNYLFGKFAPQRSWFGQKTIWFLTVLGLFLGGNIYYLMLQRLLNALGLHNPLANGLIWTVLFIVIGWVLNLVLSPLAQSGKIRQTRGFSIWIVSLILYMVISGKVFHRYFQEDQFSLLYLCLQPMFLLAAVGTMGLLFKLYPGIWRPRPTRLLIPLALTLLFVGFSCGFSRQADRLSIAPPYRTSPNIIILLFDALRGDQIGAMRHGSSLTPNIDELARQGKKYQDCYSTSSWTFPSVASLLTSRLPHKMGLLMPDFLPDSIPTVAGILKQKGYYTTAIVANQILLPTYNLNKNFDDFRYLHKRGFPQLFYPFNFFFIPATRGLAEWAYQTGFLSMATFAADWQTVNQNAFEAIRKSAQQPFFLYVHYFEPHAPYISKPFHGGILDIEKLKLSENWDYSRSGLSPKINRQNEDKIKEFRFKRYSNGVRAADMATGEMMVYLQRLGIRDNTIVIILADHGEEFLEHGGWDHRRTLYQESVRVPLIISIPPEIGIELPDQPSGVSLLDVAPTILALAGVNEEFPLSDGWPLTRPYPETPRSKYMELDVDGKFSKAVVAEPYKLILREDQNTGQVDTMLFDLDEDPGELKNLYPGAITLADSLAQNLGNEVILWENSGGKARRELTRQELQVLRALGYTN